MNQLDSSLRELKTRTGLSLAGLAAKTPYSKSSWERYLNGKTLPPREAVEELCRLAGEPEGRCVALWEIAEAETSGRGVWEETPPPPPPAPVRVPVPVPVPTPKVTESGHRGVAALAALGSVCAVAVAGVVVALLLLPHHREPRASSTTAVGQWCPGSTCSGRDPQAMHCAAQADSLGMYGTATGAWLQLRHSRECRTSWVRMWGARIGDRIELTVTGRAGSVRRAEVTTSEEANTYIYTLMAVTRPGTVVRACFQPAAKTGAAAGKRECFDGRVN
ncbi:helix-turn-helix domain-containing protein [Streptomyces prunicolor]|uniref:helix-turn-helix domain-containing protein n=1 Tax=Streptomyces prunicolor TaxID=67348 RepID=UPI000381D0F3|nr:XRE family transcriptional regulator [Streptomyces prunicolor]